MKVYIAGHLGMVGSAIWRELAAKENFVLIGKSSKELDLRNQQQVFSFISNEKPDIIIDAAARVGGILANSQHPYLFLMENLSIQNNLIEAAVRSNIQKFIFLGSSCIYPKLANQPLREEYLLTASLEPTNEWYAVAKIAGVKACQAVREQYQRDFVSLMPTNLYGRNDNFDLTSSHVLPAMIRKFHDAKMNGNRPVTLWGSGTPLREFLHADDLAKAVHFVLSKQMPDYLYNVGSGKEISIRELAMLIQNIVGHKGDILWDRSKPDGTPRKLMDSHKLNNEGWSYTIELEQGIESTYNWFLEHLNNFKEVKL